MTITEVEVALQDSYKVDNYQYIKPEIRVKATIENDESADEVVNKLEDYIINELQVFIKKRLDAGML